MPNHVYSHVKFSGDQSQIAALIAAATGVDSESGAPYVNFAKLHPCPAELQAVASPVRLVSQAEYDAETKSAKPDPFKCGRAITAEMQADYLQRFGADNWYDWAQRNWGTKWGTYSVKQVAPNEFRFETAWSPATALWERISELYPDVHIDTCFVDEGECFYGRESYVGGEVFYGDDRDAIGALVGYPRCTEEDEDDKDTDDAAVDPVDPIIGN